MDGKWLKRQLRGLLKEDEDSGFLSDFETYGYLYEAACSFVSSTKCLKTTQTITTIAEQEDYTLDSNFLELFLKDKNNQYYIKYNDGSDNTFITWKDYEDIVYDDQTDSVSIPSDFCIIDDDDPGDRISGTSTGTGANVGGESTLTDSGGGFSGYVSVCDIVHNTTDESTGIVLNVNSDTALTTALLDGTSDDWTIGDAYVIQPQGRFKLVLSPPPSTSGNTVTVEYIQKPTPVYSDYGVYRFPSQFSAALVKYAAWLYKYSDLEPNTGDALFQYWQHMLKQAKSQLDKTLRKTGFSVNFKKRRK